MAFIASANTRNGEPVSRPTALKIPPQVPLASDGGAVGGIAVGCNRLIGQRPRHGGPEQRGRRDSVSWRDGRRERPARHSRGPAALRPTCHQAERLARRSSRTEHISNSGGPASGVAGGRGGDLRRAQRTGAQRSAAQCVSTGAVRQAGERIRGRSRQRRPSASARSPATGWAALVITAGAAGLFVAPRSGGLFAQGMEARQGRDTDRRAGARCAARQPGPAQRGAPWTWWYDSVMSSPADATERCPPRPKAFRLAAAC